MKRTAEFVLGIIGVVTSGLFSLLGVLFSAGANMPEFQEAVEQELQNDPTLSGEDNLGLMVDTFNSLGTYIITISIISAIIGIVGVILIRGNKKPVIAGILFILASLLIGIGSIGLGFIPGILFLIAGILCFARKPKNVTTV